jgi:hypothetical protein
MMQIVRTDDEVGDLITECVKASLEGTSEFEDGVFAAIDWLTCKNALHPLVSKEEAKDD